MPSRILSPVIREQFRGDAENTGVFFERQLEHIKATQYQTIYAATKATQLLPVSTEAGEGATSITFRLWDEVGIMKLIATAGDDIKRVDVKCREFITPIKPMAGAFGYSIDEIAAAAMANVALDSRKATALTNAYNRLVNQIAWNGDADTGIPGLLSNPNITTGTVPDPGSGTVWSVKTAQQILDDMNLIASAPINAVQGNLDDAFVPDTMLLPVEQYTLVATKNMSDDTGQTTILKFFMENNPWIKKVDWLPELKNGNNSVLSSDAALVYKNDPMNLTLELPKLLQFLPVERRGLEFITNGHARIGGVIVYQPLSIALYDGI